MTEPLIYTSRGNMLEKDTREEVQWIDNADETTVMICHFARDNGELVKKSVHMYGRKKLDMFAEQAQIG